MIYLNEWLPNPVGSDASGEFVELFNNGDVPVSVAGWKLATENGKKFTFAKTNAKINIPAHRYIVLGRSETKLSLRNTDGGLSLYDSKGALVDRGNFRGSAPAGQSFSRVDYGTSEAEHFSFVGPTPGVANKTINNTIAVRAYPFGVLLNNQFTSSEFLAIMIGAAIILAGCILYITKTNEDLSQLFFEGDKKDR